MTKPTNETTTELPPEVETLCAALAGAATDLDQSGLWPAEQLRWCAEAGVFRWFIDEEYSGWGWSEEQVLAGYLALSQSCLTTTFILTQWNAACRRIMASDNAELKQSLLPRMAQGETFATVGISHLTTSRQHVDKPVLRARVEPDGSLCLDGFSPWVTGGSAADVLVVGAVMSDGRQVLLAVDRREAGVEAGPGAKLIALTGSCTDQVAFSSVKVPASQVLFGPIADVLKAATGGSGAGGLQTSILAVGLARCGANFLQQQAARRDDLTPIAEKIATDVDELERYLRELTLGESSIGAAELRTRANSLVLRSTQAALQAAKGAGFMAGHPVGRWAREAMFFLVWSCPQPVANANLCELAQIA